MRWRKLWFGCKQTIKNVYILHYIIQPWNTGAVILYSPELPCSMKQRACRRKILANFFGSRMFHTHTLFSHSFPVWNWGSEFCIIHSRHTVWIIIHCFWECSPPNKIVYEWWLIVCLSENLIAIIKLINFSPFFVFSLFFSATLSNYCRQRPPIRRTTHWVVSQNYSCVLICPINSVHRCRW